MTKQDIRWQQRFDNFKKALNQLDGAVTLARERELTDLEKQGLIQAFEYTHELAWNTLKDFLEESGNKNIYGSKDTTRLAFHSGLIENGEIWMNMIQSRNQSSHTYNEEVAEEIVTKIINNYYHEFAALNDTLDELNKNRS
jgi:nucleotidyltransferase substrate binding protein (TIGR01987 family)